MTNKIYEILSNILETEVNENTNLSMQNCEKWTCLANIVLHYQKGARSAPFLSTLQELSQDLQSNTALIPIIKPDTQGLHILVKGVMQ